MNIDRGAGFAILALGFTAALSLAPAAVVKAQVILQPDSLQSGATTPEKLNSQIREGAKTQQAAVRRPRAMASIRSPGPRTLPNATSLPVMQ
jgi:hypothetical protein